MLMCPSSVGEEGAVKQGGSVSRDRTALVLRTEEPCDLGKTLNLILH